jgi:hypothetical protein
MRVRVGGGAPISYSFARAGVVSIRVKARQNEKRLSESPGALSKLDAGRGTRLESEFARAARFSSELFRDTFR